MVAATHAHSKQTDCTVRNNLAVLVVALEKGMEENSPKPYPTH